MNTFKKLERLQAANTRLTLENKGLVERNKNLVNEMEHMRSSANAAIEKAQEQMKECEKLKAIYNDGTFGAGKIYRVIS